MPSPREVRYLPDTRAYLDEQIQRDPKLQDVLNALVWRIARSPEDGYCLPAYNPPRYLIKSRLYRFPLPRILRLLYTYTDDEIVIEFAQVVTEQEADPEIR